MMSNSFSDTRLPWYEIITRPPEVSLFVVSEPETSAAADTEPGLSDEDWVTRSVLGCYND